jgi:hypothetical protein
VYCFGRPSLLYLDVLAMKFMRVVVMLGMVVHVCVTTRCLVLSFVQVDKSLVGGNCHILFCRALFCHAFSVVNAKDYLECGRIC